MSGKRPAEIEVLTAEAEGKSAGFTSRGRQSVSVRRRISAKTSTESTKSSPAGPIGNHEAVCLTTLRCCVCRRLEQCE
ncbi:hypothetical protein V5799_019317 [Amblyomma americanum]|uniref:Uncharacterized protein n=1 Tax=Amblyomma americanum TaxID=6943 RepID=A0AAQ4EXN0_AMBAM